MKSDAEMAQKTLSLVVDHVLLDHAWPRKVSLNRSVGLYSHDNRVGHNKGKRVPEPNLWATTYNVIYSLFRKC